MKKIVLPGLAAGAVMLAIGLSANYLIGLLSPALKAEYMNQRLFRPWSDPYMNLYFLHPFLVGMILAWIWDKVKAVFKECEGRKRSCFCCACCGFGFVYWVATSIPGMFITFASFKVSLTMVLGWTLAGLFQALAAGAVLGKMNKIR